MKVGRPYLNATPLCYLEVFSKIYVLEMNIYAL